LSGGGRRRVAAAQTASFGGAGELPEQPGQSSAPQQPPEGMDYAPYAKRGARDPYKVLGLPREASFEEVVDARNYLSEKYKWHEESREAIEMAFDSILQQRMGARNRFGFKPLRGRDGGGEPRPRGLYDRVAALFDPTITTVTLINEGAVFGAFALWALFSGDQSFPLAAAFGYSVYQFQTKRAKRSPEGPFLAGNPMIGAVFATGLALALGCGIMALATAALGPLLGANTRQVGGFVVVVTIGILNVYLK